MNSTDTIKFIVAMIVMMNPLGSLSIFLQLTHGYRLHHQRKTALQATLAMIVIMFLSVWSGKFLLEILGISIPSFRFAGGIILLLMGLSMLQSRESPVNHNKDDDLAAKESESLAIVPIALPVIIGPGAISTLIIAAHDYNTQPFFKFWLTIICLGLGLGMGIILYFAAPIERFVGPSVIKVITRIMGMVIMSIAAGMLTEGLSGLLPILR